MMHICPVCGRRHLIHQPEFWPYRRGSTMYCSDNCLFVDATRDLQLMHKAIHKRKEAKKMARVKKDGTPAKKPGKKTIMDPDVEAKLPEEPVKAPETVRVANKSEKPKKITEPVMYDGLIVREVEGNFWRYRRSDIGGATYIDFESADGLDTLSLTVDQWRSFREENTKAAKVLGVEL